MAVGKFPPTFWHACGTPDADVFFLVGGTQTNSVIIDGFLRPCEGVIAVSSGHIAIHEAGAIEFGGHKVLPVPGEKDKLSAPALESYLDNFRKPGGYAV